MMAAPMMPTYLFPKRLLDYALVQLGSNHDQVQITKGQPLYVHWNGFAVRFQ